MLQVLHFLFPLALKAPGEPLRKDWISVGEAAGGLWIAEEELIQSSTNCQQHLSSPNKPTVSTVKFPEHWSCLFLVVFSLTCSTEKRKKCGSM